MKINALSPIRRAIYNFFYNQKLNLLSQGVVSKNTLADTIVFRKIQKLLGGNIRGIATGSAPISPKVLEFCRIAFGCYVIEGYGQTESTATGFRTNIGEHIPQYGCNVGIPCAAVEYKLIDCPHLNYSVEDLPNPRGEICLRGSIISKGYYKNPEKTKETFDKDGWLRTGDIGEITPNLTLKLVDRVKNIFKLSQGEFVAPDSIESKLSDVFIEQIFVYGNSLQSYLVAVVVPEEKELIKLAKSLMIEDVNMKRLCKNELIISNILKRLDIVGRQVGLRSFQIPKKIILEDDMFSIDNGLLTPTLKTKRDKVLEKYKKALEELYFEALSP